MTSSRTEPNDDPDNDSISRLVARWDEREGEAVERLRDEFFPRLRALSRRTLGGLPGANVEADDVVQSAFGSLCRFMRRQPDDVDRDRDDMWRLLCHLVVCKARRRLTRRGRGLGDRRLSLATDLEPDDPRVLEALAALPAEDVDLHVSDAIERLDESLRAIVLLALEGHTRPEIAERLDCSSRTINRKLERIRRELAEFVAEA